MKHIFIIATGVIPLVVLGMPRYGYALAVETCYSETECLQHNTRLLPYCCKGDIESVCPTGWTLSRLFCTRDSISSSDNMGYYTQTYETCAPTEKQCYKLSSSSQNEDGLPCKSGFYAPDTIL